MTLITSKNEENSQGWKETESVNGDIDSITLEGKLLPTPQKMISWLHNKSHCTYANHDYPKHELLGSKVADTPENEPSWRNVLEIKEVAWLGDFVLLNQIVFPAAGYISMVGEAMQQLSNGLMDSYALQDFSVTSALLLNPDENVQLQTRLRQIEVAEETEEEEQDWYEFQITSYDGSRWVERCVGKVSPDGEPSLERQNSYVPYPKFPLPRDVSQNYWYTVSADAGLQYGPAFQGLDEITASVAEPRAVATISAFEDTTEYIIHPVTLDQCFQILTVAAYSGQGRNFKEAFLPTYIENLVISSGAGDMRVGGKASKVGSAGWTGDVSVVSENGLPIVFMQGCKVSAVPNGRPRADDKLLSFIEWDTDASHCNLNRALAPPHSELERTIKILGHKNPKLRILEFGNGREGTTTLVLNALKSQYGEKLYSSYTYAALSADASDKAKELFKQNNNVEVTHFDVEGSLDNQGLKAGAYDLIITTDVFSPSRDLDASLGHLKTLINPLGHLLMLEALPESGWTMLNKDHLSAPASPTTNGLKDEKFIGEVQAALVNNGFEFGPEEDSHSTGPKVIASLKKPSKHSKKITLVVPKSEHPLVDAIETTFSDNGIECEKCTFEDGLPNGQDIVSLVDFGEPYVYNFDEARFKSFTKQLSTFKGSMIWATPIAQISCENPNSSMIIGLTRTLRSEVRKDITLVEVDDTPAADTAEALLKIFQGLAHRPKSKDVDPDYEYAIIDGEIKVPRLHWTSGEEELALYGKKSATNGNTAKSLTISNGPRMPVRFRSDACYLMVGGLGGLGRSISTWMVEHGARNILFLSRSAREGPDTTPFFDELRSQGCVVSTFAGSVNELEDVAAALEETDLPIAGIMQMSAVMRDNFMSQMTFSEWETCVTPKVQGTWNLHQIVRSDELDFFLMFSSICGMGGQWGQANYNAANSFLDAFAHYRHGQDLPASVIDIGFMGGVGMAMENAALVNKLKSSGYHYLREQDLIEALTIAILNSRPGENRFLNKSQFCLGFRSTKAMESPATRTVWKKDARMVLSHQFDAFKSVTDKEVEGFLDTAYQSRSSS
ncbi:6-hydroxymellein synthase terB [Lachnellula suecica]|uniref:6-hydroxymellein synthase terB n=1 Tax=Lachnellula suecica TaxID=602035 RepID=A0A8T9CRE2_9HELO|nr:6-hydroxymellein synthase terB [Lachnellula suecica]